MNPEYSLVRYQIKKEYSIPAKVFAYLSLYKDFKLNRIQTSKFCPNTLPFVSSISSKATPEGLVRARLSFLKYCR